MSKYLLVLNGKSGRGKRAGELDRFLEAARRVPELEIHLLQKGDDIRQLVRRRIRNGTQVVGAAGGDGTINCVASALIGTKIPLVVVPFGTLNHFARDLGLKEKPEEALALFESGEEETIDVGEVNGNFFLNNSSVGLYPKLVKEREKYENKLGKSLAYLRAGWILLRQPGLMHVQLKVDGKMQDEKAGIIFFSNNRAEMTPLAAGHRNSLTDRVLDAYIVRADSFIQFMTVASAFLRNKLDSSPLVTNSQLTEATVYTRQRYISVACDGEVFKVAAPLRFRVRPAALVVRRPASEAAEAAKTDEVDKQEPTTVASR